MTNNIREALTVNPRQLTRMLVAGNQRLSGDSIRFGLSPVTMLRVASKPKEVPSSVRSKVLLHESALLSTAELSEEAVMVERNIAINA